MRRLLRRDEQVHLTEDAHIHRDDRTGSFLGQQGRDALRLEDPAQDLGLGPAEITGDDHGCFRVGAHRL